jgi:hypothetical protein
MNWSGAGCDVKSVTLTAVAATMLSPDVGILTFKATADGTCFGKRVGPIWGSSIYVKYGDAWKWTRHEERETRVYGRVRLPGSGRSSQAASGPRA